ARDARMPAPVLSRRRILAGAGVVAGVARDGPCDDVEDVPPHGTAREHDLGTAIEAPSDLLQRALRPAVVLAHDEHDAVHEAQRVVQHQPLHLAVVRAAPIRTLEEGPANLHLALRRFESAVARAADDPAGRTVDDSQRTL